VEEIYPTYIFSEDFKKQVVKKTKNIEKRINYLNLNEKTKNIINSEFKPSNTALRCLSFIQQVDEQQLLMLTEINSELINFIKVIYILLKENENISPENIISNLYTEILPKLKIRSLSNNKYFYFFRKFIFESYL
jgi:hypothetical protein